MSVTLVSAATVAEDISGQGAPGRVGRYLWTMRALLFFAVTINYVDRQIGGVLKPLQGWSANLFTLNSDRFPREAAATIGGLGGSAGAIGGMFIPKFAGWTLDATGSHVPLLLFAGVTYLIALGIIHLLTPGLEPLSYEPS